MNFLIAISKRKNRFIEFISKTLNKVIGERGTLESGFKSTVEVIVMCTVMSIFFYFYNIIFENTSLIDTVYFKYFSVVFMQFSYLQYGLYIYKKKKKKDNNVLLKQLFLSITLIIFLILTAPIVIGVWSLLLAEKHFRFKGIMKNAALFSMKISFYLLVYLFLIIFNRQFSGMKFFIYFIVISLAYWIIYIMLKNNELKFAIGNYYEIYDSRNFFRKLYNFVLGVVAIGLSIYSMYISIRLEDIKNHIVLLMPIIAFVGYEQVFNNEIIRIHKSKDILEDMYNELLIFNNIAIVGVDFTKQMSIKIMLSYKLHEIEYYQAFLLSDYKCWRKKKNITNRYKIIKSMECMKVLLSTEYSISRPDSKELLYKDINNTLESLAECLITL